MTFEPFVVALEYVSISKMVHEIYEILYSPNIITALFLEIDV